MATHCDFLNLNRSVNVIFKFFDVHRKSKRNNIVLSLLTKKEIYFREIKIIGGTARNKINSSLVK